MSDAHRLVKAVSSSRVQKKRAAKRPASAVAEILLREFQKKYEKETRRKLVEYKAYGVELRLQIDRKKDLVTVVITEKGEPPRLAALTLQNGTLISNRYGIENRGAITELLKKASRFKDQLLAAHPLPKKAPMRAVGKRVG
jgi:hypothetical protein